MKQNLKDQEQQLKLMAEDIAKPILEQKGLLTKEKKPEDQIKIDFSKIFEKAKMMVKERWKDQL